MDPALAPTIDALEQTWTSLTGVLETLSEAEWSLPTGCPGWDVKDNVSHLAGLEHHLLGDPAPDHEVAAEPAYVRNPVGTFMELEVDYRRGWAPSAVLADFREVTVRRLAELRAGDLRADEPVMTPLGREMPARDAMRIRTLDCYAHEQDIRRATDRRGNLTGAAASLARQMLVQIWTGIVAGEPKVGDSSVVLEMDGESHQLTAQPDPNDDAQRGRLAAELRMRTSFENAFALGCGRSDARPDEVTVIGDRALYELLVPRLGFTP